MSENERRERRKKELWNDRKEGKKKERNGMTKKKER